MNDKKEHISWIGERRRKDELTAIYEAEADNLTLSSPRAPLADAMTLSFDEVIRHRVEQEPYWFHKIRLSESLETPGWSDPRTEKLPYFGLPDDLTGMRVLDIGCAEGFFSFEAERRGAREVIAIDSFPDSVRRFNIIREARQSNASAFLMNVYDLRPERLGTFDLVLFYGVFYHLKHPQLALEAIRTVCVGDMLFQTHVCEDPRVKDEPWAKFHPHGLASGPKGELYDPTVFWLFNQTACIAMLDMLEFERIQVISSDPAPFVLRASAPERLRGRGRPPNQALSPWC